MGDSPTLGKFSGEILKAREKKKGGKEKGGKRKEKRRGKGRREKRKGKEKKRGKRKRKRGKRKKKGKKGGRKKKREREKRREEEKGKEEGREKKKEKGHLQIMCTTSQLLGVKIKLKPVSFRGLRPLDPRQGALAPGPPPGALPPGPPPGGSAPWTPARGLCPLDPRQGLRPLDPRSLRSQAREKSSFPCPPLARGLVTPLHKVDHFLMNFARFRPFNVHTSPYKSTSEKCRNFVIFVKLSYKKR